LGAVRPEDIAFQDDVGLWWSYKYAMLWCALRLGGGGR